MTTPGDGYPIGAMQYVVDQLRATGDPVDAERAHLIGFMLVSRGTDVPLPDQVSETVPSPSPVEVAQEVPQSTDTTVAVSKEPAVASNVEQPSKPAPATSSNGADILLGSSAQIFDHMRDGLLNRFSATRDLQVFPNQTLSVKEEYTEITQRETVAAETGAFRFVGDVVRRLFPHGELRYAIGSDKEADLDRFAALQAPTLDRMKRLLSTVIFEPQFYSYSNGKYIDRAHVVIGAKDMGSKPYYQQALLMDITSHHMLVLDIVREDLQAILALPLTTRNREISHGVVQQAMTNDGRFRIDEDTSGRMMLQHLSAYLLQKRARKLPVDLHRGIRYVKPSSPSPEYSRLGSKRLPESMIEQFEVAKHLADLVSVLCEGQS